MFHFFSRKKLITLVLLAAVFVLTGVGCKGGDPEAQAKAQPVTLTYWTIAADTAALESVIGQYRKQHPNVTISVVRVPADRYELDLLEALAEDRGPDIFSIQNTWVKKYQSKIEPLPPSTNLPYQLVTGTLKKEVEWVLSQQPTHTIQTLTSTFVPQVVTDAVDAGKIYGLPLSFDTLALYYNRDIFNNANIINPPATWTPFASAVRAITLLDAQNNIIQSAVAMGRADNVSYAVDVVSALMSQNGAQMLDANQNVAFHLPVQTASGSLYPAEQAVLFYTDFANFGKEVYTWNETFDSSLEAFAAGETAMYFGYASDQQVIDRIAPALNYEIAGLPQIDGSPVKRNYARYWLETVSKKSQNTEWAWDFLTFATREKNVKQYVTDAELPTAVRNLLESQATENPRMSVFNVQALTAESWYQGDQPDVAFELFGSIIDVVNTGERSTLRELLGQVARQINQTL